MNRIMVLASGGNREAAIEVEDETIDSGEWVEDSEENKSLMT